MRRVDREVTDPARIRAVIEACRCCRLGLSAGGEAYIVPMSFGFTEESGTYSFYFHSATEGRKLDILRQNSAVSFEMDTGYELVSAPAACGYTARYQCVMGTGRVTFAEAAEEKRQGLSHIMRHYTDKGDWDFPDAACEHVCVFRLEAETLSCKEHT